MAVETETTLRSDDIVCSYMVTYSWINYPGLILRIRLNTKVVANPMLLGENGMQLFGTKSDRVFETVIDLDLSSLYPSIILAFNIDANTMAGKILPAEGEVHVDETAYVPTIVENCKTQIGKMFLNLPTFQEVLSSYTEATRDMD